jgi:response regulator NasT
MERHSLDEREAFNMLRDHARRTNRKMVDVAEEIVSTHRLLPGGARPGITESSEAPG